ncbi:stalk domain-containing protein [Brevibacillus daliensis]|uniref:stalk domain-containing protein n=1 Tax=Brevibacillus daliensis TaxID=2892995 RepID=UPI001E556416|nr:stalk domain-containing protein [Brevibacillus daliensis]
MSKKVQKKAIAVCIGVALLTSAIPAMAEGQIKVGSSQLVVNEKETSLATPLLVIQDHNLIALDDIAKVVNGQITNKTGKYELAANGKVITFQVNQSKIMIDGKEVPVKQGAIIHNEKVYVPLRWTLEQLNNTVSWDAKTSMISIDSNNTLKPQPNGVGNELQLPDLSSLSTEEQEFIAKVKKDSGVHKLNNMYVLAHGDAPNPGYGLEIFKTDVSTGGLTVYVKQTTPDPNKMYPMVISHPFLVVKVDSAKYPAVNFLDAETGKPLFEKTETSKYNLK